MANKYSFPGIVSAEFVSLESGVPGIRAFWPDVTTLLTNPLAS
jgi:hypothetical protein